MSPSSTPLDLQVPQQRPSSYRSEYSERYRDPAAWTTADGAFYADGPRGAEATAAALPGVLSRRDPRVRAAEKVKMIAFQVRHSTVQRDHEFGPCVLGFTRQCVYSVLATSCCALLVTLSGHSPTSSSHSLALAMH